MTDPKEVIYCKDCKYYEAGLIPTGFGECCQSAPAEVNEKGYCDKAEEDKTND